MKYLYQILILSLLLVFCKERALAQNPYWNVVIVQGTITPKLENTEISILALNQRKGCSTWNNPKNTLCSSYIKKGAKNARIEIVAPGYKRYSRNIPSLRFENDTTYINLRTVNLIESELPRIERIVAGKKKGEGIKFEITLNNPLNKDFLITELEVNAIKFGDGSLCCCPPSAVFKLDEQLEIVAGGEFSKDVKGSFKEEVRGNDYQLQAKGSIIKDGCDGSEQLSLSMPASFVLPSSEFTAIHVILPTNLRIIDSEYSYQVDFLEPSSKPDTELIGDGASRRFNAYFFSLRTNMEDELEIKGAYQN